MYLSDPRGDVVRSGVRVLTSRPRPPGLATGGLSGDPRSQPTLMLGHGSEVHEPVVPASVAETLRVHRAADCSSAQFPGFGIRNWWVSFSCKGNLATCVIYFPVPTMDTRIK